MFTAFFIGNIASGKSSATRYLESLGARRIDLDSLAKSLYVPGSDLVGRIVEEFGSQVVDEDGRIVPSALARAAFQPADGAQRLSAIVYPELLRRLAGMIEPSPCSTLDGAVPALTVVEVSNASDFTEAFGLADEVVAVAAPLDLRRERAHARGMSGADFDARAAAQPADDELCGLADTVLHNDGDERALQDALDLWAAARCPGLGSPSRPSLLDGLV